MFTFYEVRGRIPSRERWTSEMKCSQTQHERNNQTRGQNRFNPSSRLVLGEEIICLKRWRVQEREEERAGHKW